MTNIFKETIEAVEQGSRFWIDFQTRSLKVNGKYVIKDGQYEGVLGIEIPANPLERIEELFHRYHHSIPSERSEHKRRSYFRALDEHELDDEDMLYGVGREQAQVELELYILCAILQGKLVWNDFAEGKWFWQSTSESSLILLKNWIVNN